MGLVLIRSCTASALVLAMCLPSIAFTAPPKPTKAALKQANVHYEAGYELFQKGDYDGAIAQLVVAISHAPVADFFFNISKAYEKKGDFKNARVYLERYLPMAPKKEAASVQKRIDELDARQVVFMSMGRLVLTVNVAGATVKVDGKAVGKTPLPVLPLNVGAHKLEVGAERYEPQTQDIRIDPASELTLTINLATAAVTGTLVLEVPDAGGEVMVDGWKVGVSPLTQRLTLPVGPHSVIVKKPGFETFTTTAEVPDGGTATVRPVLKAERPAFVALPPRSRALMGWGWGLFGTGVGLLAGGLALQLAVDPESIKGNENDDQLRANLENAKLGLWGAGGGLTAIGLILVIIDGARGSSTASAEPGQDVDRLAAWPSISPFADGGAVVHGRF